MKIDTDGMTQAEIVAALGTLLAKCESSDLAPVLKSLIDRAGEIGANTCIIAAFEASDHPDHALSMGVTAAFTDPERAMGMGAMLLGVAADQLNNLMVQAGMAAQLCPVHWLPHINAASQRASIKRQRAEDERHSD